MIKNVDRAQYQLIFFQRSYAQRGSNPLPRGLLLSCTEQSKPVRVACASAPKVHEACGAGRRSSPSGSREMKIGRSCSLVLADAPARFTSSRCFSSVDWWDEDAPGLSHCSGASGCMGPLLAYRFAECSSLLIGHMHNAQ